jgi:hypothetical protein
VKNLDRALATQLAAINAHQAVFANIDAFAETRANLAKLAQIALPRPGSVAASTIAARTSLAMLPAHQKFRVDLQRALSISVAGRVGPRFDASMFSALVAQRTVFDLALKHATRDLPGLVRLNTDVSNSLQAALSAAVSQTSPPPAPPRRLTNPWAGVTPLTFIVTLGSVSEVLRLAVPDMPDPAVAFWALVFTMILLGMYHQE